jgi:N-acetylneuraminic acid mutarotase
VINARGDVPRSRDDHTAVVYDGSMVVFGGFVEGSERTNEIYRYYFRDNRWERILVLGKMQPVPRAGHSAVVYGDTMLVFGGRDDENNKLNDLWSFNFTTYQWEYIDVLNSP